MLQKRYGGIKFIEFYEKLDAKASSYIYTLRSTGINLHHLMIHINHIRTDIKHVYTYSGIDPKFTIKYFIDKGNEFMKKINEGAEKYKIPYLGYDDFSYY